LQACDPSLCFVPPHALPATHHGKRNFHSSTATCVGKPKELDSLHDTAVHGMRNVAKGTGDFLSGVKQGVKQEGEQGKQA